jgi:hypothetical protein
VLFWGTKTQRPWAFRLVIVFALPLALGAVGYAWYNHARFDSITEFGLRYQLNSFNIHDSADETFSIAYVPPNLFKTLINPLEARDSFPFIRATRGLGSGGFERFLPDFYLFHAEGTTGMLVGSPFLIFAVLAGFRRREETRWILCSLTGAALLIFLTLQLFFYTAMRYLLDLLPALCILTAIGFWRGLDLLKSRPWARWAYILTGVALWIYGFAISFLLTISSHLHRFEEFNPGLLEQMRWTFNGIFK